MRIPGSLWKKVSGGLQPVERVLAAVSGGPDSMALLHLVLPPAQERDRLVAAYIHHGTGAHADEAEAFVRREGLRLGVDVVVEHITIDPDERAKWGFEAAAREQRYRALERIAVASGCVRLLTAHTRDDQAESFLLAALRGAGTGGLAGVRAERGRWQRPLLSMSRLEVRNFLRENGIQSLDDPANEDERYARVRVRSKLRPAIVDTFGEGAWRNLAVAAERALRAEEALEDLARKQLRNVTRGSTRRWISIDAPALHGYFADVRARILMAAWAHAADLPVATAYLDRADRRRLEALVRGNPGDRFDVDGVAVRLTDDRLVFDGLASGEPHALSLPGSLVLPDGARVEVDVGLRRTESVDGPVPGRVEMLDADLLGDRVIIRSWQEGDRFHPLGRRREVKVVRALRRPPGKRVGALWVLEASDGRIALVFGERIAETFKVRDATRRIATVTFHSPPGVAEEN